MKKLFPALMLTLALVIMFVMVMPVLAMPHTPLPMAQPDRGSAFARFFVLQPDELANLLLGFIGVVLSAAFKYFPKWKDWYEKFPHQGLLMLGFVVIAGGIYFALACSPYAEMLKIQIMCDTASIFLLVQAIVSIAIGNQLAYLYLPEPKAKSAK